MALTGHQRYKGPLYPGDISAFGAVFYLFKWLLLEPLSTVVPAKYGFLIKPPSLPSFAHNYNFTG